jgi:hypothetical protein
LIENPILLKNLAQDPARLTRLAELGEAELQGLGQLLSSVSGIWDRISPKIGGCSAERSSPVGRLGSLRSNRSQMGQDQTIAAVSVVSLLALVGAVAAVGTVSLVAISSDKSNSL